MRKKLGNRLFLSALIFLMPILLVTVWFYLESRQQRGQRNPSEQIVAVNELEQLAKEGELAALQEKSLQLQENLRASEGDAEGNKRYLILGGVCMVCMLAVFGYVYIWILAPFEKMKEFAGKIAQGNFDVPLNYTRANYFGDFTWAFDSMRNEITKARASEREAALNNKTVIATLSHDIKTPIASIRAYAEGLEANLDNSPEKRQRYLSVIMKKCDEVAGYTDDLFLHSLSDLDKLKITEEEFELCGYMKDMVDEISAGRSDIHLTLPEREIFVIADAKRVVQVCENLINNARKYAKTDIDVSVEIQEEQVCIRFRDHGNGIPDEDMPFIFGKFYRGKNCGQEPGSGLGLYIVKYITEKMGGKVLLHNHADGLEVTVFLRDSGAGR